MLRETYLKRWHDVGAIADKCVLESFMLLLLLLLLLPFVRFVLEQEWLILVVWLVGKQDVAECCCCCCFDDVDEDRLGGRGGGGRGRICFWLKDIVEVNIFN